MCNACEDLHYDYARLAWDIGFQFDDPDLKSDQEIDVIGLIDVDRIIRERDIAAVIKQIPTLLNLRLDQQRGRVLEPNFVKLFKLSQLSIQYLRFCFKYLDSTVVLLKGELAAAKEEREEMGLYILELKRENKRAFQKYHELQATLSTNVFKCSECYKTFYSEEYLEAHVMRRHGNLEQKQAESDKLQLEIKELKQRLNNTERLIQNDKENSEKHENEKETAEPNNDNVFEDSIQFKFEQLKNHIEAEINSLKGEDFYRNIYEKLIKERHNDKLINDPQPPPSPVIRVMRDVAVDQTDDISKPTESSTQTESAALVFVNEGTSMSPPQSPRKSSVLNDESDRTSGVETAPVSIKSIEEKLSREVEIQRETLEQILDLKLSGSLNKMEAQMDAFWEKLNAWESNLVRSGKSSDACLSSPLVKSKSIDKLETSALVEIKPKDFGFIRQNSIGTCAVSAIMHDSPPQPKPRKLSLPVNYAPIINKPVVPLKLSPKKTIMVYSKKQPILTSISTSESSEDESESIKQAVNTEQSDDDQPINIKPTESFKQRLDRTLSARLKSPFTAPTLQPAKVVMLKEEKPELGPSSSKSEVNTDVIDELSLQDSEKSLHDMKKRLKRHVEESVNQKLREIGVSPHWRGLPEQSYKKAMEIVEHQAALARKNIKDFDKIRNQIIKTVDEEVHQTMAKMKRKPTTRIEKFDKEEELLGSSMPTPPHSSLSSNSPYQSPKHHKVTVDNNIRPMTEESPSSSNHSSPTKPPIHVKQLNKPVMVQTAAVGKKKVLFDLDSDSEAKSATAGAVNDKLSEYLKKEKSNVEQISSKKGQKNPGSESDWDISEISQS